MFLSTSVHGADILYSLLFLLTAVLAVLLNRQHKKEKKRGPSPSNNYTSGSGRKSFFKRDRKPKGTTDAELGVVGAGSAAIVEEKAHHHGHHSNGYRPSNDTGITGTTAAAPEPAYGGPVNKYNDGYAAQPRESGYNAYAPQTTSNTHTGTTRGEGVLSADHGVGHHMNQPKQVFHDTQPYAEVHGSGLPHQAQRGDGYVT